MLLSLTDIQQRYHQYAAVHPFTQQPRELYEPIQYILDIGGKRLRPALVLMAANLFQDDIAPMLPAAYAVEIFHNFTLVHDDIMDEAPLRRGHATIHTKYDTNVAILAGDAMLVHAYQYLLQAPQQRLAQVIETFNGFAIAVCEGQQMDVNFESRSDVTIAEYLKMIELKTAALIEGALKIGALLTDASTEDAAHLAEFGRNIGIAFQLQDDILDTFGDPAKFGKKVGGDIAQNKKTYLVLKSLQLADDTTQTELAQWLSGKSTDEATKIEAVKAIFSRLSVRDHANQLKNQYLDTAYAHLDAIQVADDRKVHLRSFAERLVYREV